MKVNLIYYTGMGSGFDFAAKLLIYVKNTRLEQGQDTRMKISFMNDEEIEKELDYIAKTIRSSWEFIDYTFEIQGVTRAFTHQLVRTRTASYAQQAQRVVDMSDFTAEEPASIAADPEAHIDWISGMSAIAQRYRRWRERGIPAQDCRAILPTNVHTNIIAKMNLRTLADLVGKRENLRAQGEYEAVIAAMKKAVLAVHPWVKPFLNPERTKTPALDAILRKELGDGSPIDKPQLNEALKELDALKGIWG